MRRFPYSIFQQNVGQEEYVYQNPDYQTIIDTIEGQNSCNVYDTEAFDTLLYKVRNESWGSKMQRLWCGMFGDLSTYDLITEAFRGSFVGGNPWDIGNTSGQAKYIGQSPTGQTGQYFQTSSKTQHIGINQWDFQVFLMFQQAPNSGRWYFGSQNHTNRRLGIQQGSSAISVRAYGFVNGDGSAYNFTNSIPTAGSAGSMVFSQRDNRTSPYTNEGKSLWVANQGDTDIVKVETEPTGNLSPKGTGWPTQKLHFWRYNHPSDSFADSELQLQFWGIGSFLTDTEINEMYQACNAMRSAFHIA